MSTSDSYRRNAEECLRLAETNILPETRAILIAMAQSWLRLAQYREDGAVVLDVKPLAPVT